MKPSEIEALQVEYLSELLRIRGREKLVPAMKDLVTLNGAWTRALFERESTELVLSYDPDLILGPASLDLPRFIAAFPASPTAVRLSPGPEGPVVTRRKLAASPSARGGGSSAAGNPSRRKTGR